MADLAVAYAARREGRAPGWADAAGAVRGLRVVAAGAAGGDGDGAGQGAGGSGGVLGGALAGLPEELVLPADRPRPAEPSQRGGVVRWELADAGLHAGLAGLARERQATVFMVVHGGAGGVAVADGGGDGYPGGGGGGGADR